MQIRPIRPSSSKPASLLVGIVLMLTTSTIMSQTTEASAAAIVNGTPIPQSQLERAIRQQVAMGRNDTPELRTMLLEELISQEVLHQEALRLKLDQSQGFVAAMENARRSALAALALQSTQLPQITDAEVRLAYDRSIAGMHEEDFRLRAIVVSDQAKVKSLLSQLARGGVFEELAVTHSRLASARTGGDLGWMNIRRAGAAGNSPLPDAVTAEVRKLSKGGFTDGIYDGRGGWWLVKLEETRPAQMRAFKEAAPQIRRALETAARDNAARALLSQLRSKAKVSLTGSGTPGRTPSTDTR